MAEVHPLSEFKGDPERWRSAPVVPLADKEKVRHIVRLQLATEPESPNWVVRYCWGLDREGNPVSVDLGVDKLPREGRGAWTGALIEVFKSNGRWPKAMKLFEPGTIAKVW